MKDSIAAAGARARRDRRRAQAQISDGVVKIGVLNDESGPYADLAGPGSRVAALMAIEDFDAAGKGIKVELVFGDHRNSPELGRGSRGNGSTTTRST